MALFATAPEELKNRFIALKNIRDIATLLEIKYASLIYYVRKLPDDKKYSKFSITKKSGGEREISAPIPPLRFIQKKLNYILQNFYEPYYCVHGFVNKKNIVTNASRHTKQRYVANIDLKDFFPSINFGRVRGMFMANPFNFNSEVATFLAQICCNNNQLPQGAPTSPVISNCICFKLDGQLLSLAKEHNCRYTRYADDLSFSTYLPVLASEIMPLDADNQKNIPIVSDELTKIINDNGFEINRRKVRLRDSRQRQVITGLTTNKFPNVSRKFIRQVRAMLHAWQKFGLDKAEQEYLTRYDKKHRNPENKKPRFYDIVRGKINFIGMVRGKDDEVYINFCKKLKELNSEIRMKVKLREEEKTPIIITEGISDWKHLKAAFRSLRREGFFPGLKLEFSEFRGEMGYSLLQTLTHLKQAEVQVHGRITIAIFDRDNEGVVKAIHDQYGNPRYWGNKLYSFCIPIPGHRPPNSKVFIELYYTDDEIKTRDSKGRRLFFNNEFDPVTGKHKAGVCCCKPQLRYKLNSPHLCIIDNNYIENGKHTVLYKNQFADNVLNEVKGFDNFKFSEFKKIFEVIEKIIGESSKHY